MTPRFPYIALFIFMTLTSLSHAASPLTLLPTSRLWLEGKSTLHDFKSYATTFNVQIELEDPTETPHNERPSIRMHLKNNLQRLTVTLKTTDLKSSKKGLDKSLHKTLKSPQHPTLQFTLTKGNYHESTTKGVTTATLDGTLTLAGISREMTLTGNVTAHEAPYTFKGHTLIDMSDFDIKKPKKALGLIQVNTHVHVFYEVMLESAARDLKNSL